MHTPQCFVDHFVEVWRDGDPARLAGVFHADGTLLHPGMTEPLRGAPAIEQYFRGVKALIGGMTLTMRSWAAHDERIFIEWRITGEAHGRALELDGVDIFTVRGGRATAVTAYFDPRALLPAPAAASA